MRPCPRERALSISQSSSNRANISRDAFPDTTGPTTFACACPVWREAPRTVCASRCVAGSRAPPVRKPRVPCYLHPMAKGIGLARVISVMVACLMPACGGRAERVGSDPGAAAAGLASGGNAGSASEAAAGDASAPGGAFSTSGAGGSQAGAANLEPPADIAARWAMVNFEDPVGWDLSETNGVLSGKGCASGVPPVPNDPNGQWCGTVSGTVVGNHASFGFAFMGFEYLAETTISADGSRMTGRFHSTSAWVPYPMAWLRVADGKNWLPQGTSPYAPQAYDLRLTQADSGAEYVPAKIYGLNYFRAAFSGDLGSFALSETSQASPDAPLIVGPVPMTVPELPVSLVIQVQDQQFTELQAVTGSGHHYTFSARPRLN